MSWRTGLTVLLLLAAIASGWSVWKRSRPAGPDVLGARPDYVLHDFEMTSLGKDGTETFTLRGPLLQRDPGDKTMAMTTPLFLVPDRAGQYWDVRADSGFVPADGERLDLRGNVLATSPAGAAAHPHRHRPAQPVPAAEPRHLHRRRRRHPARPYNARRRHAGRFRTAARLPPFACKAPLCPPALSSRRARWRWPWPHLRPRRRRRGHRESSDRNQPMDTSPTAATAAWATTPVAP